MHKKDSALPRGWSATSAPLNWRYIKVMPPLHDAQAPPDNAAQLIELSRF